MTRRSYTGRVLEVDLTRKSWRFRPYPGEWMQRVLCGRGFNVRMLYDDVRKGTDPLGPDNPLIVSCGLLTGTIAPASSRVHFNALSPLTGLLGSSNVGGGLGNAMRTSGLQTLILRGACDQPSYLLIDGDSIRIMDARTLWGLDAWETLVRLRNQHGNETAELFVIGPGGEKRVRYACILTDLDHAAGRTGLGAVMGAKMLKAVVISGRNRRAMDQPAYQRTAMKHYIRQIRRSSHARFFSTYGGAGYVKWADDMGILATRNYRQNRFEAVDEIDGTRLRSNVIRARGCYRCPVKCKAELRFDHPRFAGVPATRPEFEPMVNLGSKCGLADLEALVYVDNLCSRLGIDSISTGNAIAFAMDLFDRKILTIVDTGGLDLSWGNGDAMETLIRQIAARQGLGSVLALGVRRAAEIIGKGAEDLAPHVKGLELSAYHPYNIMGTALGYAVSNRGGDYNNVYASLEYGWSAEKASHEFGTPMAVDITSIFGKAPLVRRASLVNIVLDCLGLCKVPALSLIGDFDLENEAELATAVTGQPWDAGLLFQIGERIMNLERLFNIRHGARGEDDRLPRMFFSREYISGNNPAQPPDWMEPMLLEFYRVMGWDEGGCPRPETLTRLGIRPDDEPVDRVA